MQALYDYATRLDVRIEYTNLTLAERVGEFDLPTRTVYLQHGMTWRLERSTLAHELAHATFSDELTIFARINAKMERRADEWAAAFLINANEYAEAEEKYGSDTKWIAQEVGVIERIVIAHERRLQRIGDELFTNARMGAGQWLGKVVVA